MKRPIEILYSRLSSPIYCRRDYSSWPCRGRSIAEAGEIRNAFTSNNANPHQAYGVFLRRYAVDVPASEQMTLIKQLRERTSAPIKDVKSALNESKAAVVELNCETDFVARNEIFQYLALSLAKLALLVESSSQQVSGGFFGGPEYLEKSLQLWGENVKLRRTFAMSTPSQGIISTYLHTSPQPGLGRIAGILSLEVDDGNTSLDALQHVGSELAMHIVAAKPLFITKDLVSSDALENEREILKSQAESTGKSEMAIEKMVEGRLRKYYEDVVLMEQKFIVNDTVNVKV
ncbi:translation elongation factor Ts [Actinidia rufa]|uniref:Elongation factor Ts, mitochondrial n=1 Tax=Actinidia rufa TaxID=165716 RepID=A0A7J0G9T8_9ERIC|nr:translation elongation factor Ts [Actinidia rufa]